ncbi:MAG: ATP-binding protein [Rhodobacteraceae bacterium]|nr:ATP-binding protein [Paracoccaceae bacterium]
MAHLHFMCGLVCAGKSTVASELVSKDRGILLAEDEWLSPLFGAEMKTLQDYITYSERLKTVLEPHLLSLLAADMTLVLDFPANTPEQRRWLHGLCEKAGCSHTLHFLDTPPDICKARLQIRNASGEHPFAVTEAQFDRITARFQPPTQDEGFNIKTHSP